MGLLRFFLAFVVFCGHSSGNFNTWITSTEAVRGFYVISGFLMALILTHPSKYSSYSQFVTSRFLRLWPCFICVTFLTLIARLFSDSLILKEFFLLSTGSKVLAIFPNLFMVGSDWICFLSTTANVQLVWESPEKSLIHFLLIPQAWTLGIEFSFYAFAYFIIKNNRIFTSMFFLSLFFNLFFLSFENEPISYRFFLSELIYFYIGIFSFKISGSFKKLQLFKSIFFLFLLILFLVLKNSLFYYLLLFILLPDILTFDKSSICNFFGHLSYPFYLIHKLAVWFVIYIASGFSLHPAISFFFEFLLSLGCAIFLYYFVIKPLDVYRKILNDSS